LDAADPAREKAEAAEITAAARLQSRDIASDRPAPF
jgi:hypothetical protein